MPNFTIYDKRTGKVLRTGSTNSVETDKLQAYFEHEAVHLDHTPPGYFIDLETCTPIPYPERPSTAHEFDYAVRAWFDPRSLHDLKLELFAAVEARRWLVQTCGLTLPNGIRVSSEDDLAALIASAERAALTRLDFKAVSGWVTLSLEELKEIDRAVTRYVQACFTAERGHCEAIEALANEPDALAYDVDAGWPQAGRPSPP